MQSYDFKNYDNIILGKILDEIVKGEFIPQMVETPLIPFEGVIIYSSLFSTYPIHFDNGFKKMAIDNYNNSVKYYHL